MDRSLPVTPRLRKDRSLPVTVPLREADAEDGVIETSKKFSPEIFRQARQRWHSIHRGVQAFDRNAPETGFFKIEGQ